MSFADASRSVPGDVKTINVTTLNCWGLKYISSHRHARLCAIGDAFARANPQPSIVGLQECWTQQDYHAIRERTQHILPYGKFYHGGIFGAGLVILSRWPIIRSSMHAYPLNGRPTAFFRGDWFVGKGVACATIRVPRVTHGEDTEDQRANVDMPSSVDDDRIIEVFNTHLHAPYEREPNDSYICHRTAQAWEISKLMSVAAERGRLVVGLGDFNMRPNSLAYRIIQSKAPVRDAWRVLYPNSPVLPKPAPNIRVNIEKNGTTCDSAANTWRWSKGSRKELKRGSAVPVDMDSADPHAKRLDYIFLGLATGTENIPRSHCCSVENVTVGMTHRHPQLNCSLSDHFSVDATISLPDTMKKEIPKHHTQETLQLEDYEDVLSMIGVYRARELRQRKLRLAHFLVSLAVSIACLVGVWWTPGWASFLLMLLSTLGLCAGVIDGLIGGLFVGSELRALQEFEWEVDNSMGLQMAHDRPENNS
ncbi:MAG: phospholipase C type enzyme [Alyxoria varia]|nr:MAG: phospholipase C type enzyme [Alyxoria varia]